MESARDAGDSFKENAPACREVEPGGRKKTAGRKAKRTARPTSKQIKEDEEFYSKFLDDGIGPSIDASTIQRGPPTDVDDRLLNAAVKHYNDHCGDDSLKICHPQLLTKAKSLGPGSDIHYITFAAYSEDDDVAGVDNDKLGVYKAKVTGRWPAPRGCNVNFCRRKCLHLTSEYPEEGSSTHRDCAGCASSRFVFAKEYNVHPDILSTGVIFGMLIALPITLVYYILLGL